MKPWVKFIWSFTHPPIHGIHTRQGQCVYVFVQAHLMISAWTVNWESMDLEEVYTLVGRRFSDGRNMKIFLAKIIILIIRYVFGLVASDGVSYQFGHSIFPLRVQYLKHKTGYQIFWIKAPQAIHTCPETSKGAKLLQSKTNLVRSHPTCILLQIFISNHRQSTISK